MIDQRVANVITRRQILRGGAIIAGAALMPAELAAWARSAAGAARQQQGASNDPAQAMRAQMGAAPIERTAISDTVTMLSGPGGNIVVVEGPDGKVVVDTFVQPAWGALEQALNAIGPAPVAIVIDTHWHFDHADNNAPLRQAGAAIVAHENTRKRLSTAQRIEAFGMSFPPAPAAALPTQTFKDTHTIYANGDQIELGYVPPAHTDTDIYIRYSQTNALHLGDLFFTGTYPFLDGSSGGSINGMIAAADLALKLVDAKTRIVPGHGPMTDRAGLTAYRDMMVAIRDRVQKLKQSGRTVEQVVAEKPTADFDETWGKGFLPPDMFVTIVYNTL